jgi:hypothetical protein
MKQRGLHNQAAMSMVDAGFQPLTAFPILSANVHGSFSKGAHNRAGSDSAA